MNIKRIRDRTAHYLSDEVALASGLSLSQLQQFVAGTFHPNREQIEALACRMS